MAKKPKSENYDALGSIFDFIFQEAEKPRDKRRPIKPTGVAGDRELTNAIAAALEVPGAFVSNQIVDQFNDALDMSIAKVEFDPAARAKVEVKSNSLIDFLKDPEKAVNKAVQKRQQSRQMGRAMFMRAGMEDFIASAWAHKYANEEAKAAIYGSISAREARKAKAADTYRTSKAMGEYLAIPTRGGKPDLLETTYMADRGVTILGRKTFGESEWNRLPEAEKIAFNSILSTDDKDKVRIYLESKYSPTVAKNFMDTAKPLKSVNVFSPDVYRDLEVDNLSKKIDSLKHARLGTKDAEDRAMYQKTLYLLKREKGLLNTEVERIKSELRKSTTPAEKKALQRELKDAKGALRVLNGEDLFGRIGKAEGLLNSFNNVYGGIAATNLIPSIMSGDFYDQGKNQILNPATKANIGKSLEIIVPNRKPTNPLLRGYNEVATDLFYITPTSVARTLLYNGEGFAYLFDKQLYFLANSTEFKKLKAAGFDTENLLKGLNEKARKDLDTFITSQLSGIGGSLTPKELKRLQRHLKSAKSYRNATELFSTNFRFLERVQGSIKGFWDKTVGDKVKKLRNSIGQKLLTSKSWGALLAKTGADKLLMKWMANGGIQVFMRSMVTAVAGALGLAGGPVASWIISALTWVATDFAMKVLGVGINILKWAALGLIAIFALIAVWGTQNLAKYNKQTYADRNVIPASVVQCPLYEEVEIQPGEDLPWEESPIIPPNSGASCVLGGGSFWCSQGYKEVGSWSHKGIKQKMPVDLTGVSYIYAPQFCDKGDCKITRIAKINCRDGSNAGGIVEFDANDGRTTYHFILYHTKPLAAQGAKLSGGQPVGVVQDQPEVEKGWCWTGKHLHLQTLQNGGVVDPLELLQGFSCSVPDEAQCARP